MLLFELHPEVGRDPRYRLPHHHLTSIRMQVAECYTSVSSWMNYELPDCNKSGNVRWAIVALSLSSDLRKYLDVYDRNEEDSGAADALPR